MNVFGRTFNTSSFTAIFDPVFWICAVLALVLTGCLGQDSGSESGSTVVTEPTPGVQPPLTTPERTICDPFSTNSPTARDRGVIGNLVWLDQTMPPMNGQPAFTSVSQYLDVGNIVESTLYFDRLYVPTRAFDLGFMTQSGQQVLNYLGQPMYEYFALRLESQLQLAANEAPGRYQVAVLSDDGARLKVADGAGNYTTLVNNDGDHATRMACSVQTITLDRNSKIPMVLEYYQGPRYHIALTVMWRPLPDGTNADIPVNDPLCGASGNDKFFNSNVVPSAPKAPFYELLARNWKVLENENYYFPEQASNPCTEDEGSLAITQFTAVASSRTSVDLAWLTNIGSTSQIEVRAVATGVVTLHTEDPALTSSHAKSITGLSPNTIYAFRAISRTPGGQVAYSDERAVRTPR